VKSASYILMQGVPSHVSLDAVRTSIRQVEGVVSVHEVCLVTLHKDICLAGVDCLLSTHLYIFNADGV
jgi:zinc transporter 1